VIPGPLVEAARVKDLVVRGDPKDFFSFGKTNFIPLFP
jgi:hypothetical protein